MTGNRKIKKMSLCKLISIYCKINGHQVHNFISLLRKSGSLICSNGFRFDFNSRNKNDILRLFYFTITYGVKFSQDDGFWRYKDGLLTLPNGIRFFRILWI